MAMSYLLGGWATASAGYRLALAESHRTPKPSTVWGLCRGYVGIIGYILELYRDNGKENGKF